MNFWTSDNHWGHTNIIDYCSRPFRRSEYPYPPDVHAMDRTMIERWNTVVGSGDTVYHLGDFSMKKTVTQLRELRKKLNGRIVLVRGNHDRSAQQMLQAGFDEVHDRICAEIDGLTVYMAHIPIIVSDPHPRKYAPALTNPPPPYFDYWLAGHVHEKWRRRGKVINVGVDQWDFTPRRLDELLSASDPS